MLKIGYNGRTSKFEIECTMGYTKAVMGMPERTFRKKDGKWMAPVIRRNCDYMFRWMSRREYFSEEAWDAYSAVLSAPTDVKPPKRFPDDFNFANKPLDHQLHGLQKWFPLDVAGIFFEQGLGKTFTAINLAAAWRIDQQIEAVIVVCPSSIKFVWAEELAKHCPIPYETHVMVAGKAKAVTKFTDEMTGFQWLLVGIEALSQGNGYVAVERFARNRKVATIIDESSGIKTPGKIRTDRCIKLSTFSEKRMILSGTSVTQGLEDLYSQFEFLDPEIIGFSSYFSFRNHFCKTMSIEVARNRFIQKIVGYKNEDEFIGLIGPYAQRVEKVDALDLPPKTFSHRYVPMSPVQRKIYDTMLDEFAVNVGGLANGMTDDQLLEHLDGFDGSQEESPLMVKSVLEQSLRLLQIMGGHYPFVDAEGAEARRIPGKNNKVEELVDIIKTTRGKVVVWFQFRAEVAMVAERLAQEGIAAVEFHGGCEDTQRAHAVGSFVNDPQVKVFLATRAASRGITLTAASTAVYFSFNHSLEDILQSQDRIHRIGQNDPCLYIYLLSENSIGKNVLSALEGKENLAKMVYGAMKSLQASER